MASNLEVRYFSYGPKCENAKIGPNWAFFVEKHAVYAKFWKYIPILWPMCFLVDLVRKKIKIKINRQHPLLAIFLYKAKIKKKKLKK